ASGAARCIVSTRTLDAVTGMPNTLVLGKAGAAGIATILNGLTLANGAVVDATPPELLGNTVYFTGSNPQSIGGNGAIFLGSNTSSAGSVLYNYKSTNTLTIAPGVLIHGKNGTLTNFGTSDAGFLLPGTVSAD